MTNLTGALLRRFATRVSTGSEGPEDMTSKIRNPKKRRRICQRAGGPPAQEIGRMRIKTTTESFPVRSTQMESAHSAQQVDTSARLQLETELLLTLRNDGSPECLLPMRLLRHIPLPHLLQRHRRHIVCSRRGCNQRRCRCNARAAGCLDKAAFASIKALSLAAMHAA